MWVYEKKLQYPVNIKQTNPKLAKIIISQYGGSYFKKIYKKTACKDIKKSSQAVKIYTIFMTYYVNHHDVYVILFF